MLAAPGPLPDGGDWVVEFAWEGLRCIAYVRPDRARLRSVNGRDVTPSFPELVEPLNRRAPRGGMVLDGTLVAVGEGGLPRRRLLQRRTAAARPSAACCAGRRWRCWSATCCGWPATTSSTCPTTGAGAARGARPRRTAGRGLPDVPVAEAAAVMRIAEAKGVEALHARHLEAPYRPGSGRGPGCGCRCAGRAGARRRVDAGRPAPAGPGRRLLLGVPDPSGGGCATWAGPGSGRGGAAGGRGAAGPLRRADSPFGAPCPPGSPATRSGSSPRLVGRVEFTGFTADGRLRLPRGGAPHARRGRPAAAAPRRPTLPRTGRRCPGRAPPGEPDGAAGPAQDIGPATVQRDRGPAPRAALRLQRAEHHRGPDAHRPRPGP